MYAMLATCFSSVMFFHHFPVMSPKKSSMKTVKHMSCLVSKCCQKQNCLLIIFLFAGIHISWMVKWELTHLQLSGTFLRSFNL